MEMTRGGCIVSILLASVLTACSGVPIVERPPPKTGIAWGPPISDTMLSPLLGVSDPFPANTVDALRAAVSASPALSLTGVTQSSDITTDTVHTAHAMAATVRRDDDGQFHWLTDSNRLGVMLQRPRTRDDTALLAVTTLSPGNESDLASYPHDLLGLWTRDGVVGAFALMINHDAVVSRPLPTVHGVARFSGDSFGMRTLAGVVEPFVGTVILTVRYDPDEGSAAYGEVLSASFNVRITDIRPPNGATGNSPDIVLAAHTPVHVDTFGGNTTRQGHDGKGRWGGTWVDNARSRLHGTFGWTASDGSATLLGTWTAIAESDY